MGSPVFGEPRAQRFGRRTVQQELRIMLENEEEERLIQAALDLHDMQMSPHFGSPLDERVDDPIDPDIGDLYDDGFDYENSSYPFYYDS